MRSDSYRSIIMRQLACDIDIGTEGSLHNNPKADRGFLCSMSDSKRELLDSGVAGIGHV